VTPGATGVIRVLLAEDQTMVRTALASLLNLEPDIEVVAQVSRGDEVTGAAVASTPDVALLDIEMPGATGLDAADELRRALPGCRVLILTTFGRPGYLRRAMEGGAAGFLLKDTPPAEIVRAIELVHAGDGMLSPTVTRRLISMVAGDSDAGARAERARDRLATLSPRERDVALAVGRGETNAEIAAALHLSVATVKAHVSRLLDKLDVDNRVQIALLVQAAGEH
jgi:DNA-binding NarL/FixJ family response regulator